MDRLLRAVLKADQFLGGTAKTPPRAMVRAARYPLRTALVIAAPLTVMVGLVISAFTDLTEFLQLLAFGAGLTLFFWLLMRLERRRQVYYARHGHGTASRVPPAKPPHSRWRIAAELTAVWVAATVAFWGVEKAKGTPVSLVVTGAVSALLIAAGFAVTFLKQRRRLKRHQR